VERNSLPRGVERARIATSSDTSIRMIGGQLVVAAWALA
jgi:hypothetical protein